MKFPIICVVVCSFFIGTIKCLEFDEIPPNREPRFDDSFHNWQHDLFNLNSGNGYMWPLYHNVVPGFRNEFEGPQSRDIPPIGPPQNDGKDREPLDLDYVSGPINGADADIDGGNVEVLKPTITTNQRPGLSFGFGAGPTLPGNDPNFFQSSFPMFGHPNGFHNFFQGFGGFNGPRITPWWKGDNVCTEREEDIEDWDGSASQTTEIRGDSIFATGGFNLNFESCVERPNKHVCKTVTNTKDSKKRTLSVTHQCCHGFGRPRNAAVDAKCAKLELISVAETSEKLGAKEFIRSAKNNGLEEKLFANVTIFAPNDEAFTSFSEEMFESNLVVLPLTRQRRQSDNSGITTKELVLSHIVEEWIDIEDVQNEQILKTAYNNATIRINIFPRPPTKSEDDNDLPYKYTANCAPIIKANKLSTNGIVHIVERVLPPVTQNIMEIIRQRSDMTVLRTILEKSKLDKMLEEGKALTIFAPNDKAFEKLEPSLRRTLKEGSGCAINILKNHILDITFCSCAVASGTKTSTFNILDEKIRFDRSESTDEKVQATELADLSGLKDIIINGNVRMLTADLMATNGVVHIIDTIIPTETGLPVSSMMEKRNISIFKNLIEAAGLGEQFDDLSNVTFFAPSDKSFEGHIWKTELENNPDKLKGNNELKEFLEYHIAAPLIKTCDLTESSMKTRNGDDLRVDLYSTHPIFSNIMNRATVNCARLIHFDDESCGAVLHQVDRVLEHPEYNLLQLIESNEKYSMFAKLIKKTNLTSVLDDPKQSLTILIPSNEVFSEVKEWYDEISENQSEIESLVRTHIITESLCCAGIVPSDWPFIRTVETINSHQLRVDRDRRPKIQNAGVTKCDIIAKNGIVHEINDVISVKPQRRQHNEFQQFF